MPGVETVWILKALVLPPGGLVVLGLLGFLIGVRRIAGSFLIILALSGLYLLSTPYIGSRLISLVETHPPLSEKALAVTGAEAIVVLGGGRLYDTAEYAGDTVNSMSLQRLRYAARLARKTGLAVIPVGGSTETGRTPEAEMARAILEQEFSVQVAAVETDSRTTWENAVNTAELLDKLSLNPVLLVTHAMHMPRALSIFQRAGIDAIPAPTAAVHQADGEDRLLDWLPSMKGLNASYYALHELLGYLWYSLRKV